MSRSMVGEIIVRGGSRHPGVFEILAFESPRPSPVCRTTFELSPDFF
jgi:hypothetical protein